jgi:hypothetical protein
MKDIYMEVLILHGQLFDQSGIFIFFKIINLLVKYIYTNNRQYNYRYHVDQVHASCQDKRQGMCPRATMALEPASLFGEASNATTCPEAPDPTSPSRRGSTLP